MRTSIWLAALIACAPAPGAVDPVDDRDVDDDTDEVDPYAYVRCDGTWLPAAPAWPSDVPVLVPERGHLDEVAWEPELPPSAFDPTTASFAPLSLVPEAVRDRVLDWPEVPDDLTDRSDTLVRQERYGDGPWTDQAHLRFDDAGRMVAQWEHNTATFWRHADDGSYTQRELFFRDDWRPSSQTSVVIGEGVQLTRTAAGAAAGDFEGRWTRETLSVRLDTAATPALHDELTLGPDGVSGRFSRFADGQGDRTLEPGEERELARAFVSNDRLVRSIVPVVLADGGRTVHQFHERDSVSTQVRCPSDVPGQPDDTLSLWTMGGALEPAYVRATVHDGAGGWTERWDSDGDGRLDTESVVTWDPEAGVRTTHTETEVGGEPAWWDQIETLDDRGVVVSTRIERSDGRTSETRLVPAE